MACESPPAAQDALAAAHIDPEAVRVAIEEDGGWWKSCSGCHETNEGQETGHYPYSALFRCHVGAGCRECGGLGVRWEYYSETDLAEMAKDVAPAPPWIATTDDLVDRFARALKARLNDAGTKPGRGEAWRGADWAEVCRAELQRHIDKGDARDVAAYAAFCWHHGWSTRQDERGLAIAVNLVVDCAHAASAKAGWWADPKTGTPLPLTPERVAQKLMLIVSEVAEAMESHRKGLADDKLPHRPMMEVELADAVIRIADLSGALGFDLGGAVAEKMAFNATRPDHALSARAAVGGKLY